VVRPMSDATLDRVAVNVFLAHFTTDWSSASSVISSAAEDGKVKMDLKACGWHLDQEDALPQPLLDIISIANKVSIAKCRP
jgi:hypothetical protein